MALYQPVFGAYVPRYAPSLFSDYLPTGLEDAARFLDAQDRWS